MPPVCSWVAASASSSGSQAAEKTSHTKKSKMPTAMPFSTSFITGIGRRMRPTGIPIRIVTPAMKPSRSVLLSSMVSTPRWLRAVLVASQASITLGKASLRLAPVLLS